MKVQGDKQWFDLHNKHITASRFGDVLADPSTKRYKGYMNEIIDSIIGVPYFEEKKPWFEHGTAWEQSARQEYEWETGNDVIQDFFFKHPKLPYVGCSPDGFVKPNINIEIKSHKGIPDNLQPRTKLPSSNKPQVQGQMWVTGRKHTDFVDYYRDNWSWDDGTNKTALTILRVLPDLEYHKKLEAACISFWQKIQERLK